MLLLNGRHTIASDVAATENPNRFSMSSGVTMKPPMYAKLVVPWATSDAVKSAAPEELQRQQRVRRPALAAHEGPQRERRERGAGR